MANYDKAVDQTMQTYVNSFMQQQQKGTILHMRSSGDQCCVIYKQLAWDTESETVIVYSKHLF